MNKDKKIKETKESIENIKSELNVLERYLENLEKENWLELPWHFKHCVNWFCFVGEQVKSGFTDLHEIATPKKQYALLKLQYIADQLNGDWKVDYNDIDQEVWGIFYAIRYKKYCIFSNYNKHVADIYFKSEELAEKALEIMGQEIEYLKG